MKFKDEQRPITRVHEQAYMRLARRYPEEFTDLLYEELIITIGLAKQ